MQEVPTNRIKKDMLQGTGDNGAITLNPLEISSEPDGDFHQQVSPHDEAENGI